jgi:UDP-3-O-[3-hydroxymyristoyl] N-acetylglucosamine deacetylase
MMNVSNPILQTTIAREVELSGIGLHTGKRSWLCLKPARANTGIVFVPRGSASFRIPAFVTHVTRTELATTLGVPGFELFTIEHLLSSLFGLGVDNILVEMDGPEIPIMDGSSLYFVKEILDAGLELLDDEKRFWIVRSRVKVGRPEKWIECFPSPYFELDVEIDFPHPVIGKQRYQYRHSPSRYIEEIAPARTFGFLKDVEAMRRAGLALGGSLENAVVIDDRGIVNPGGLRFPDEFARHKVLDLIGDLGLVGGPIIGKIRAYRPGHELNHIFLERLLMQGAIEPVPASEFYVKEEEFPLLAHGG